MNRSGKMGRQQGWTLWSLVGGMALVAFFALLIMKLFPPYLDNFKLKRAIEAVAQEPGIQSATKRQIISKLQKRLYVDYADELIDLEKALKIEKGKTGMSFVLSYEVVVPMAYNVSALIEFDNRVDAYGR
jgi:hypothetical protein